MPGTDDADLPEDGVLTVWFWQDEPEPERAWWEGPDGDSDPPF
jgi:hypothetical protein